MLSVGMIGCSIKTPYLNITQWPAAQRAMYYNQALPYRVVVLPLIDQRPGQERTGKTAPGMFLGLWNRRVGDYYTGDRVFGNEVSGQLSGQLAAYLRAANVFTEVIPLSDTPRQLELPSTVMVKQLSAPHAADYLLAGELEHFFGSQHQQTSMLILPLYFINTWGWTDSKTLPWGRTTIRLTLYDGHSGDIIWRQRFEANHTLPRQDDPMSEAALESFASVAEEAATALRGLPLETLREKTP